MEIEGIGRNNINQKMRHRSRGLTEEDGKMIEELQQQIVQIEKQIYEIKFGLYMLNSEWGFGGEWRKRSSELDVKKMELDILTFAHKAYRDKNKNVLSLSSGKPEVNIHNLNYRMLHEARSMQGERRLLNMMNPKKNIDSGLSLDDYYQQIGRLSYNLQINWPNVSRIEKEKIWKKEKELWKERDQLYGKSPIKGSLWNSLPYSARELRIQIKALEIVEEEKRRVVSGRRKETELSKIEQRKAEKEIEFLRKTIAKIQQQKQKCFPN